MEPREIESLIEKLVAKSQKREVEWGKTSRDTEYVVTLNSGSITSDVWTTKAGENFAEIAIYNSKGDKIYQLRDAEGQGVFGLLVGLNNAARENFYRTEETLESMSKELEKEGHVGGKPMKPRDPDEVPF